MLIVMPNGNTIGGKELGSFSVAEGPSLRLREKVTVHHLGLLHHFPF